MTKPNTFSLLTFLFISLLHFKLMAQVKLDSKSYDAKNIKKVEINSPKGEVKVSANENGKVEVSVEKIQFDPKCRMAFSEVGTTLKIVIDQENIIFDKANCVTKISVKMPKDIPLEISTGTSSVSTEGITSEIGFKSATGPFMGIGLNSNFSAATATGAINLKYANCPNRADIDLMTASSDAEITFSKNCKLKVSHKSATGELFNEIGESKDYKVKVSMKSASGSLKILKSTK